MVENPWGLVYTSVLIGSKWALTILRLRRSPEAIMEQQRWKRIIITEFKTDLVFLGVYFYYATVVLLKINKRVGDEKLFSLFFTSEELTVVQWASQGNSF